MKKTLFFLLALSVQGCASIVGNSANPVWIDSNATDTEFVIRNRYGLEVKRGRTPAIAVLETGAGYFKPGVYTVEFNAPGYQSLRYPLESHLNAWYWGNLLNPLGMLLVDPATGAMWRLPSFLKANLPEERHWPQPTE